MNTYVVLKHLHVSCVALSGFGFFVRGLGVLRGAGWVQKPWVRVAPHVVDSLLLGSALLMAWLSAQYPFAQDWLTGKLLGLLVYIGCGTMALKRGRNLQEKRVFFLLALLAYGYVVNTALTRQPLWF